MLGLFIAVVDLFLIIALFVILKPKRNKRIIK